MVQQERSRISIGLAFSISVTLSKCSSDKQQRYISMNMHELNVKTKSGFTLVNENKYSGGLYNLFINSKDTSEIRHYLNGKETGRWRQYYPGHKLKDMRSFYEGKKTGNYTAWWENGMKQLDYNFLNNEYEGICREWNNEGILVREMNYHRGHEEGSQKLWYDNGKIRSNYIIASGRRFGLLGTKNCKNASDSIKN